MDNLETPADRAARHRAWLESFGFSDEDWRRIRLLASEVTEHAQPAALDDLSLPIRVGAQRLGDPGGSSGRLLGVIGGQAIRYWRMNSREIESWMLRRKRRS